MSLRSSTIYVEPKTVRRLLVLTKLYPEWVQENIGITARERTADERVDVLINEVIKEKYPAVIELERELSKMERDFIERMKTESLNKKR